MLFFFCNLLEFSAVFSCSVFPDGPHYSVPATCLVMQRNLSCSTMLVCVLLHHNLLSLVFRLHSVLLFSLIFGAFRNSMLLCFFFPSVDPLRVFSYISTSYFPMLVGFWKYLTLVSVVAGQEITLWKRINISSPRRLLVVHLPPSMFLFIDCAQWVFLQ